MKFQKQISNTTPSNNKNLRNHISVKALSTIQENEALGLTITLSFVPKEKHCTEPRERRLRISAARPAAFADRST